MQVKSEPGRFGRTIVAAAAALLLAGASHQALAQSAAPGSVIVLDPIVISAGAVEGSTLSERLSALPGGVALVEREEMTQSANLTASRALSTVPGVVVQDFFGANDQPRIQIRGSGLQQNPVERGILMLQDGLPLNRADGSYIVGFLNPNTASALEIYRGYTANRLGANVLGGAINMISPTGSSRPGVSVGASGGSFGQIGASGEAGYQGDGYDVHLRGDFSRRDGFRTWNESSRAHIGGNVGIELSDTVRTRLFFGYTDLGFDVAGPLPKSYLRADPRQVHTGPVVTPNPPPAPPIVTFPGPNVVRDQPRREAEQFMIGARTTAEFDAHLFDLVLGYTYTDDMFRFPISSGIRVTEGGDFTGVLRYAYQPDASAVLPLFEATGQYTIGSADRENYHNLAGAQGPLFGRSELDATSLSLNAGFNVPLGESVIVSPAIAYSHATRDNRDVFAGAARPTVGYMPANPGMRLPDGSVAAQDSSYERRYGGWSPSLGVSWRPDESQIVFGAVSRSFEAPTHDDLLATVNGTPNTGPGRNPQQPAATTVFSTPDLDAQTATTIEAGWRGNRGGYAWDATVYYSWIDNELISLRDSTGAQLGAINADKTTHFGVELGLTARIADQWSARLAYTYQDFRFAGDMVSGPNLIRKGNRLGGAPTHVVNAVLQYDATENWMLQGAVRWLPSRTPVDNMNSLYADPYAVVDLRTRYRVNDTVSFFAEVTNVFDTAYAASTLVVDKAQPDQAAFIPGDGRGFFVGVNAKF